MTDPKQGWLRTRFGRLSTGLKMLLILSLFLFPLGLIAVLASVQSARENDIERTRQTQSRLHIKAQRIDSLLLRTAGTIRAASAAIALTPRDSGVCETTLMRLTQTQRVAGSYAFYAPGGEVRCASPGYMPPRIANPDRRRSHVEISSDGELLRFALFDQRGAVEGTGQFARASVVQVSRLAGAEQNLDLNLTQGRRTMVLRDEFTDGAMVRAVRATAPVADGRLQLGIAVAAAPMSAAEILTILLPVLMWIGAASIGWFVLNRLVLRPLVRMQRAVSAYQPGDRGLDLPVLATPAREIRQLGAAFDRVTRTVARHEAELEAALERQTKLVREVHHRVKNNLQVVASLLNLHARGATSDDVAAAYASIQRRVDALAVVHRNHYAELEENRGVALKPLISELGAGLRASAPASASHMQIRLATEPFYATQDVAVSVAFLVTEMAEFAMFCGARSLAISLAGGETDKQALLSFESESLIGEAACDEKLAERFDRIVTGLSRQLRSKIERDTEAGRYSLVIAVVGKGDQ